MSDTERPQLYLITPPELELTSYPDSLAQILDAHEVACVRLALSSRDEENIARAADALRQVCHARDVALVIESHVQLVERLGLDGVHMSPKSTTIRKLREDLGADAIIGAYCGASRHDGLSAGEAGADYIAFGPVRSTPLDDGTVAPEDLFSWWSEVVEIPVVAEGALDADIIRSLTPFVDFFAIGPEIWGEEQPQKALRDLLSAMV